MYKFYNLHRIEYYIPDYKLYFLPFWIFEYHKGLDRGVGKLNAINSNIELDSSFLKISVDKKTTDLSKILKYQKYELIDDKVKMPLVTDISEVKEILNYKLPIMLESQDIVISKIRLIYFPYWKTIITENKKQHIFMINALDEKDIGQKLMPFLEEYIIPKADTSDSALFVSALDDFLSPKKFIKSITEYFKFKKK